MKVLNNRLVTRARRLNLLWPAIAWLICAPLHKAASPPRAILVFDLHLIGDLVMLLPLLSTLRKSFPSARLVLVAGPWADSIITGEGMVDAHVPYTAPWVKPRPFLRMVKEAVGLVRHLRRRRWDWAIDVRGDIRHILLMALSGAPRRIGYAFTGGESLLTDVVADDGCLAHLADHHERILVHLGVWPVGQKYVPELHLLPHEKQFAKEVVPFVGFHFGASVPLRRLPPREAAQLVSSFARSNERMVLFQSQDLIEYNREMLALLESEVSSRLETWSGSLREFIVVVSRARRIFAMDSGPAHIAAALGVPTVVFFGPNRSEYAAPLGAGVNVMEWRDLQCRPCQNHCVNAVYQACLLGLSRAYLSQSPHSS